MDLRKMILAQVKESLGDNLTAIRKSQAATPKKAGDDGEPICFVKYLRGAMTGNWNDAQPEEAEFVRIQKTLNGIIGTAGGFLVPPQTSNEITALLRAKAVIRGLGASTYDLSVGDTLTIPRQTGGATAYWVKYTEAKSPTDQAFGQLELVLKECAAVTRVKNTLLEDASPAVDTIVKNDLATVLALAEDLAFINGTGGPQPLGLLNNPLVPTTTLGGGAGAVITYDDLLDAMYAIEAANGQYTAWLMHPRTKNTLRQIKDANGNYIYLSGDVLKGIPDMMLGMPVAQTTQMPINFTVGVNANCSAVILANWPEYAIAQKSGNALKLDVTTEGGDAFLYNETWFRASRRVDAGPRQPNEFYIIRGILP